MRLSFTDGTVAGTDVVTGHDDPEWRHDYTYYGNGCENKWDDHAPLNNQSEVSCSSRLTETADEETQKIGTYYNFSAANPDSGSVTTENANSPNSFCPLGWQIPYGGTGGDYYDGSKSWKYLSTIYNAVNPIPKGYYPFSYISAGARWGNGTLGEVGWVGYYVSITSSEGGRLYRAPIGTGTVNMDANQTTSRYPEYTIRSSIP